MNISESTHGWVDFGVAGSRGSTLVLGGSWATVHGLGHDLSNIQSLVVRQRGIRESWGQLNIDQLFKDLPNLVYVDIDFDVVDGLAWLNCVPRLEHFGLRCKKIRKNKESFKRLPLLRSLNITGQDELLDLIDEGLETLTVVGYGGVTLEKIMSPSLVSLELNKAHSLENVDAVKNSPFLNKVDIYSAPRLASVFAILSGTVQFIRFSSCRSICIPAGGVINPRIKRLELIDCGDIGSIQVLMNSFELERVQLSGTFVSDGVVGFLARLPKLNDIRIQHRKNYDYKFVD